MPLTRKSRNDYDGGGRGRFENILSLQEFSFDGSVTIELVYWSFKFLPPQKSKKISLFEMKKNLGTRYFRLFDRTTRPYNLAPPNEGLNFFHSTLDSTKRPRKSE